MEQRKYRIGYTTGVFDLFHIGHLNILKNAKDRCHYLIVGVSTDDVVESYKHKRPIVCFEERIEIVKAIRYADEVVPQTSLDKVDAWEHLHYDALFHGDDWKGSSLYTCMEEKLSERGVDTVYLPHTQGVSSTKLVEILQNMRRE